MEDFSNEHERVNYLRASTSCQDRYLFSVADITLGNSRMKRSSFIILYFWGQSPVGWGVGGREGGGVNTYVPLRLASAYVLTMTSPILDRVHITDRHNVARIYINIQSHQERFVTLKRNIMNCYCTELSIVPENISSDSVLNQWI